MSDEIEIDAWEKLVIKSFADNRHLVNECKYLRYIPDDEQVLGKTRRQKSKTEK